MSHYQGYGYQVPMAGNSPQGQHVFLQASPQPNIIQLPGNVQLVPSPGHMMSALPTQGQYVAAPSPGHMVSQLPNGQYVVQAGPTSATAGYFPNTPIVPVSSLPVQYAQVQTQPTPHYALAAINNPLVIWDVFQPPEAIRGANSSYPIYLEIPAVEPAVSTMRLVSNYMPWMITIKKRDGGVVTVGDVFNAIYQQLQEPVIHSEWRLMGSSSQKKVTQHFHQRNEAMGQTEDSRGIRRVDYLLNRTAFVGIKQDPKTISELVGDIDMSNAWLLVLGERSR